MSYLNSIILDDNYGFGVENTPMGEQRSVQPNRLVGTTFVGTTLDPNFYTATTINSATVSQANNQVALIVGTNSAGSCFLQSVRTARYTGGSSNRYRAQIMLSDTGLANNYKRWGAIDGGVTRTDGCFFELSGQTLNIATMKAGVISRSASTIWNKNTTVPTLTNVNTYEIYWTNSKIHFVINDVLMHTIAATTYTWSDTLNLKTFLENTNYGNTTGTNLFCRVATIYRLGNLNTNPTYFHGTTAASTVLKYAAGTLNKITLNDPSGTLISIYDSIGTATNPIAVISAPAQANPVTLTYDVPFNNGLYIVSTGTWDYTVNYE